MNGQKVIKRRSRRYIFPSFKSIALMTSLVWVALSVFISTNNHVYVDKVITTTQLFFYMILIVLVAYVFKKIETANKQKKIIALFLIAIVAAFLTDASNYIIFNFLQHANFFIHAIPQQTMTKIDRYLKVFDYSEIFLWYVFMAAFLVILINQHFQKAFYKDPRFYLFSLCLLVGLAYLLYLSQPINYRILKGYNLITYVSSIVTLFIFIISIYGLIYSKSTPSYLLFSSMIIMMCTQVSAFFYYNYRNLSFMKIAYSAWLLWVMLAFLAFAYLCRKKKVNLDDWFMSSSTLEASLAYKTLVVTSACLITFFIVCDIFNVIGEDKFISLFSS
jgi:hypothetical protein